MVTRDQLIALIEQGRAEMLQFAAALTETERASSGDLTTWKARDVLAHVAFWNRHFAERLAAARAGRDQEPDEHYLATNDKIFERYRGADWSEIEELLLSAHSLLIEQVSALSDEDLNIPGKFPTLEKGPLWRGVAGSAYSHPVLHLGTAYMERGEQSSADALRAREETLVSALDSSPDWQAVSRYNLACHWALSGEPQKALGLLAFSLRHRPDLIEWAPQDADLASLHNTPEFQALIEQARKEQQNS